MVVATDRLGQGGTPTLIGAKIRTSSNRHPHSTPNALRKMPRRFIGFCRQLFDQHITIFGSRVFAPTCAHRLCLMQSLYSSRAPADDAWRRFAAEIRWLSPRFPSMSHREPLTLDFFAVTVCNRPPDPFSNSPKRHPCLNRPHRERLTVSVGTPR